MIVAGTEVECSSRLTALGRGYYVVHGRGSSAGSSGNGGTIQRCLSCRPWNLERLRRVLTSQSPWDRGRDRRWRLGAGQGGAWGWGAWFCFRRIVSVVFIEIHSRFLSYFPRSLRRFGLQPVGR